MSVTSHSESLATGVSYEGSITGRSVHVSQAGLNTSNKYLSRLFHKIINFKENVLAT